MWSLCLWRSPYHYPCDSIDRDEAPGYDEHLVGRLEQLLDLASEEGVYDRGFAVQSDDDLVYVAFGDCVEHSGYGRYVVSFDRSYSHIDACAYRYCYIERVAAYGA